MRIDVALVPAEAHRWTGNVYIVVDQLRASSTIVTLLDQGCRAVLPAASLAEARRLGRDHGALLAGERNVVRVPGFDLGNSPTEVAGVSVAGRAVAMSTRNGTAAIRALPVDCDILVGCLRNATVCARAAVARARSAGVGVGIVCAGRLGGFALDDAVAAGCIVERMLQAALPDDGPPALSDGARGALQLWQTSPDVEAAIRNTTSGGLVARLGPDSDIPFCADVDASGVVPMLVRGVPPTIERLIA